jgi:hypothetical protein
MPQLPTLMAHGLGAKRLARQIDQIEKLNDTLQDFTVPASIEVDILEDRSLDLPDGVLRRPDLVVASVHSHFEPPGTRQTEWVLRAMENKNSASCRSASTRHAAAGWRQARCCGSFGGSCSAYRIVDLDQGNRRGADYCPAG